MKKALPVFLAVVLMAGSLSACSSGNDQPVPESGRLQVVTTIFPEYDWVMNILGDNPAQADVTMLLDTGVDLHSFQPSAEDILKVSTCDLFIYVGGESDEWVEDALQEATNKDMIVINLLDVLGDAVKEEEVVEGMQEEDHDHEHEDHEEGTLTSSSEVAQSRDGLPASEMQGGEEDHEEDHDDHDHEHEEGETEYDEHVWLSLKNAAVLADSISDAVKRIDPDHADLYEKNTASFVEKLNALDAEYQDAVSAASVKTLLFGDRFPFRYLVDDYGLSYYAAFVGCSAETEASFETIDFLAKKVDELSLHAVMTIEGPDHRIAETIVQSTQTKDQQILTMDSMQSVTAKDVESGATYLSAMEKNLSVLKDALK